jgi:nucleoside-diphosphate-sugar epimerase
LNGNHREVLLVTGATGLLGSHLLPLLHSHCPTSRIVATLRDGATPAWLTELERVTVITGDLRDSSTWRRLPSTITHVFHLAAAIDHDRDGKQGADLARNNLAPTQYLAMCCQIWPRLRQVVYSSSTSVYGQTAARLTETSATDPRDPYATAKLAGEELLQVTSAHGLSVACLRYTSLYGPGMRPNTALPSMIRQALDDGEIVVYGQGHRTQDFLHCHDAASANLLAYERNAAGIYNIGSGAPVSMAELARTVSEVFTDGRAKVTFAPDKPEGPPGYAVDIAKAGQVLGYRPRYQLEAGLRQIRNALGDLKRCTLFPCW